MDFMVSNFCEEERQLVFNTSRQKKSRRAVPLLKSENDSEEENRLPPEMELGNIEYKAKLVSPSTSRLEHLVTQMKWRLSEGQGEAIYELGVEDDGRMVGMADEEYTASMKTLRKMADTLQADIVECTEREVGDGRRVAEVLVRRVPESQPFIESRLAILGGPDVGKSTLCGVLTHQALDDGNGKTRLNQFRYLHEFQTGKTSSVCLDLIGFDSKGKILNYTTKSVTEMVEQATKIVHLIDLAGDAKYLSTTIYGLSAYSPHACCLIISAVAGPTTMTKDHLGLAVALSLPVFVVITKKDAVDKEGLKNVIACVTRLLCRAGLKHTIRVKTKKDAVRGASLLISGGAVPILSVSSVSGEGLRPLRSLLNALSPIANLRTKAELVERPPLFTVEETYQVPHVGEVVCGVLAEGRLRIRDQVLVGPTRDGLWQEATIGSVRRSKLPVLSVDPGQAVALSLISDEPLQTRRGMVVLSPNDPHPTCQRFTANLLLLCHSSSQISEGFECTFFIGCVRQTARIESLSGGQMPIGRWTQATIRFLASVEFVREGTPLIFRHGKTRGMGDVTQVLD